MSQVIAVRDRGGGLVYRRSGFNLSQWPHEASPRGPSELTHCWEGDEPLHQQPGGWAEAAGSLDQHLQPHLEEVHKQSGVFKVRVWGTRGHIPSCAWAEHARGLRLRAYK